jgi:hypothetical protein
MKDLNYLLTKYSNLYNDLTNTVYLAYKSKYLSTKYPKYCHILYNKIQNNEIPQNQNLILSKEDIEQQLKMIWFIALNNYLKNKPAISLKQYLIRISLFKLRDYMKYQLSINSLVPYENKVELPTEHINFKLDLEFVCLGNKEEPWNILYPVERYILYLFFTKELSVMQIAQRLRKDKHTISKQLKQTLIKLRSNFILEAAA